MAIELTPAASARMRDFLGKNPSAPGVRFGIRRTGCSGFGYTVDLASEVTNADKVFDLDGVKVVVDAKALPFVDGTRIDYAREGMNAAFVFHNPNATGECGCGESFTVESRAG
ncbi:MAG: iron-sulfur cluster assembly accessory protein [Xanthomonadaceae bacterium]|nr:iron-sulfur cluster assembly accessory protein [Xanthomonadaceae bacterium]MDE2054135.1 iron-sulfur cluster assembly accessory protein [Xanthomonadaceae bacterium]